MDRVRLDCLPSQMPFIRANEREVLGYGGYGGGKTFALCARLLFRAAVPGAREGLCRRHLVTLKASTLRTLLHGDGPTPPVLPPGSYLHNKSEKCIRIRGGGEIVYFGVDDSEKIGSLNLTGCAVDQAEELTEDQWAKLVGRTRVPHCLGNQRYAVCNPGSPTHHLAIRFGVKGTTPPGRASIHIPSLLNTYTTPEYRSDLDATTGVWRSRYVLGEWVGAEGLVYDNWDRERMVREEQPPPEAALIVAVDDGISNPCAILAVWVYPEGRMHVGAMQYKSGLYEEERVKLIRSMAGPACEAVVIDPSAASIITACRASGLRVVEAQNAVNPGISLVHSLIGSGRLSIDPRCKPLLDEMDAYAWDDKAKQRERPVKSRDHACDALRYAVYHVHGGSRRNMVCSEPDPKPGSDRIPTFAERRAANPNYGFD